MTDREFVRRAKRYARKHGLKYEYDPSHGKGSHGTLVVGSRRTTVSRGELPKSTYHAMLKQLGISTEAF